MDEKSKKSLTESRPKCENAAGLQAILRTIISLGNAGVRNLKTYKSRTKNRFISDGVEG